MIDTANKQPVCLIDYADWFWRIRDGFFFKKSPHADWQIPFDAISVFERIGSGSQGCVYRGQYQNRTVAIKQCNNLKETEMKYLRHLHHPNIIEFFGVLSNGPLYCIVMEYCSKGQICNVLKSKTLITRETFSQWVKEIADGMDYLHQNRVIHRDLKSQNILVSAEDFIKICDFGVSCEQFTTDSTKISFVGTPALVFRVTYIVSDVVKTDTVKSVLYRDACASISTNPTDHFLLHAFGPGIYVASNPGASEPPSSGYSSKQLRVERFEYSFEYNFTFLTITF
uniref:Protein kinase domain-containing protein n=1 Tax=Caenorhabditis japonica TaxID=281687 RepID=A0A8R1DG46_CAEJA